MYILLVPILLCLLAGAAIVLFLLKRWWGGLVVVLGFVAINEYTQTYPFHAVMVSRPVVADTTTLRVLAYNVNCGGPYFKENVDSARAAVAFIDRVNPDILFLPEYNHAFSPTFGDSLRLRYPYFGTSDDSDPAKGTEFIFSRFPIANVRLYHCANDSLKDEGLYSDSPDDVNHSLGPMRVYGMDADIRGKQVYLVFLHLKSNNYSVARRKLQDSVSWISGVDEYVTRIQLGYQLRSVEAEAIRDSLAGVDRPILMAGDFNDLSGSYVLRTIMGDRLKNAWWNGGYGFGFTYHDYHLLLRLDHILYSKEFELQRVEVLHPDFSDHYPLVADFKLR